MVLECGLLWCWGGGGIYMREYKRKKSLFLTTWKAAVNYSLNKYCLALGPEPNKGSAALLMLLFTEKGAQHVTKRALKCRKRTQQQPKVRVKTKRVFNRRRRANNKSYLVQAEVTQQTTTPTSYKLR